MAQTKAEAAVMEQTAAKFEQVNDSLQSMLKGLMSELEGLQTAWQGLGAKSFHQVKAQWMADQKVMSVALAETAKAIRASGSGYTATDSESASRVSRTGRSIDLPL
jgi:WXG100 family type VII secretion target